MHNSHVFVDLGNSRLKWCFSTDIQQISMLTHEQMVEAHWGGLFNALQQAKDVTIANVASVHVLALLLDLCSRYDDLKVYPLNSLAYQCGVKNAYSLPSNLGIDRWLVLLAAYNQFSDESVLIADCGSAVTLDIIDERGLHQGGCIVPGLRNLAQCLFEKTALPETHGSILSDELLGRSTADCIQGGAIASVVGMIQLMSERYTQTNDKPLRCVLTGSDATIIQTYLSMPCERQKDLVMKGMLLVLQDREQCHSDKTA